jgi:hypothetical protein
MRRLLALLCLILLASSLLPALAAPAPEPPSPAAKPAAAVDLTVRVDDADFWDKWYLLTYDYQPGRTKLLSKINFVDIVVLAGDKEVGRFSLLAGAPVCRIGKIADSGNIKIRLTARSYFGRGDAETTLAYGRAGQTITVRSAPVVLDKGAQASQVVFEAD